VVDWDWDTMNIPDNEFQPLIQQFSGRSIVLADYGFRKRGNLKSQRRNLPLTVIHRDELARFLKTKRRNVNVDQYEDDWFTVNKMVTSKISNWHTMHRAIDRGEIKADTAGNVKSGAASCSCTLMVSAIVPETSFHSAGNGFLLSALP
jgi:hypothetical protein